ncbi:hypothetical protein KVL70_00235 [Helicobacter pylori]|uniref:hypothetical protein n=1 Tax=Helicobacter pylori TaxID=210 RepID=UPI00040DE50E|nr:hypothetical protein [Helicobacter pylori]QQX46755.1 hypothetical protein HG575_00240 [Helicobacter pylori]WQX63049.1 hypothetical protein KVL70_00235 [Helicobacter pylori]WRA37158.1 hypothetical protein KVM13_00235 [Helicobacter pylori]
MCGFALNFKRFQKARRVTILFFHKELGGGGKWGFFYEINHRLLCMKNKLPKGYDNSF